MIHLFSFHHALFFALHGIVEHYPSISALIIFIAKDLDLWVILLALIFGVTHTHGYEKHSMRYFNQLMSEGVMVTVSVFFAWLVSVILKGLLMFPRPFLVFPELTPLFEYGGYNSFPSGHATLFMALAVVIYLRHRRIGILFIIFAVLISLARVIAGIHFPVDILAGWIIGAVVALYTHRLLDKNLFG